MKVKKWIISGDNQEEVEVGNLRDSLTLEDIEIERVLSLSFCDRKKTTNQFD